MLTPLLIGRTMVFVMFSLSMIACINQNQSHDCNEYAQAIEKLGQQTASNLQVFTLQSKQGHIQFLNSMANGEKQNAKIFQSMKLKDSKSKKIQIEIIKIAKDISQNFQSQSRVIESLPENSDRVTRDTALKSLKQTQVILLKQLENQSRAMDKYCDIQ